MTLEKLFTRNRYLSKCLEVILKLHGNVPGRMIAFTSTNLEINSPMLRKQVTGNLLNSASASLLCYVYFYSFI